MVVSAHHLASAAGVEIMRQGGNAIDAAVATGFALAVTYPRAGNLGGGGFMIVHTAAGESIALDFREVAPAAAHRDLYLDADGEIIPRASTHGYLANGVPGTVAGLGQAWARYGSGQLSWAAVLEPARRLAAEGFALSAATTQDLAACTELLSANAESHRIFLRDGEPYQAGEWFRQPDLAATIARLQEAGPSEFYTGRTAELIAADQARGGGLITREDLAAYRVVEREPIRFTYRGFEFVTMPPPSSGGIALAEILGLLEPYDLRALRLHSTAYIHLVTEAMRRAFRDRAEFLGDPDFYPVPQVALLSPETLAHHAASIDLNRATPSDDLPPAPIPDPESHETTHFAAVDAAGNVASCTYTLNGLYGNGVTAAGTGVLLNNEMDDFTSKVGEKNMFGLIQGESNAIAPGKRPLSSMTPTVVLRDGAPYLVTGSPGGPTIITTVLQVCLNVIDHQLPLQLAVDAPRFHHQWQPDQIVQEPFLASPDTLDALERMGHTLATRRLYGNQSVRAARYLGDAESILIDPATKRLEGVNDHRSPDSAAVGF